MFSVCVEVCGLVFLFSFSILFSLFSFDFFLLSCQLVLVSISVELVG